MSIDNFIKDLCNMQFSNTFNPYSDFCETYDEHDAPQKRAETLKTILETATHEKKTDSLWIGRDLGHRGGRRTGLALTDDVHFSKHAKRWDIDAERPTKGKVVSERTASVIWDVLSEIQDNIFLWNVFPLHPHEENSPFSNRSHNAKERDAGEELLTCLIEILDPQKIIAIGNDAYKTVEKMSGKLEVFKFRHPSYGGQNEFIRQARSLYCLS